jgi:hypothetical protein
VNVPLALARCRNLRAWIVPYVSCARALFFVPSVQAAGAACNVTCCAPVTCDGCSWAGL